MPQGCILFNIFINDIFLFTGKATFCNYADDSTMYSADKNAKIVISILSHDFALISEWFYKNYMVLNIDKSHFLTVSFNEPFPDFSVNDTAIENVTEEKTLGIVADNKLSFKSHLKNICKKANQKVSAFSGISKLTKFTRQENVLPLTFSYLTVL